MAERDTHVNDTKGQAQASPKELQQRLRTTRESITQTVAELKSTMNHEYQYTKDQALHSVDWKVQMRKYPVAACVGALAFGFLAGRALGHARDEDDDNGSIPGTTRLSGSSLAQSGSESEHHLISPEVRRRAGARVENVLSTLADNFLNELTRVGRDVVVPSLIGAVTAKLHNVSGEQHDASAFNTGTQHVGGTGSFGSDASSQGGSGYSGRAL